MKKQQPTYHAINDKCIVRKEKKPTTTSVGLYIGDMRERYGEIYHNCRVLSVGPGWPKPDGGYIPYPIAPGDWVVVSQNGMMAQVPGTDDEFVVQMNAIAAIGRID